VEGHAEAATNQFGHAAGGPEVGGEAVGGGFVGDPAEDLLFLLGGRETLAARMGLPGQGVRPGGAVGPHPGVDGDGVDAEEIGDVLPGPAVEDLCDGEAAAGFHPGPGGDDFHDGDRVRSTEAPDQAQLPAGQ